MPDISVIVPIYNAMDTLPSCLGNLLNQTKKEMEYILVDDESTDNTSQILKDAKKQFGDKVILLNTKHNSGPGAARNLGLSHATGSYIGFVDSDDLVDPSMYEKLYERAVATNADIVDCAFYRASQNTTSIHFSGELIGKLDNFKRGTLMASGGFIVTKIFRRNLLMENHIIFRSAYGLEDMDFLIETIANANMIANVEEILYHYRDSDSSLSKEQDIERYTKNHLDAMQGIYDRLSVLDDYNDYREKVEYAMLSLYRNVVNYTISNKNQTSEAHCLEILENARLLKKALVQGKMGNNQLFKKYHKDEIPLLEMNDRNPKRALTLGKPL